MRYVLDTSAILAHYRQEDGWEPVQKLFEMDEAELLVASVTLTEFGRRLKALGASQAEAQQALEAYQLLFTEVVSIDKSVALAAFDIGCQTPERLPLVDAFIVALASNLHAILVHRDEHMRQLPAALVQQIDLITSSP